ncbi:MAG: UDP-2,3-diacylglucosamine diphosphatase [Candidatus Eisenbacteria bacterium]|uniref:UDP-2,3-diacylglucosamine diphosphatase n=1 Tax=Eiseniibacteriota bacterium TaxID=2212470 RepID=A0A9D6L4T9_UNCEI|nr:UDP-2,3-diacylglucosamine diphosphatase [Candidatus Eisenbacteria bacterium]MBI3538651.1 UDP-2,3-diacylglucosamine diphosphatase [Candidatus Eisenbacteria bacterium]
MSDADAVYFFSDAHLGLAGAAEETEREHRLHEFLTSLEGRAAALYIVGDLFDFWFEYRTAIPRRHFATLATLRRLREAGVAITYLNGNHDFWLGPFLRDDLGLCVRHGDVRLDLEGHRIWLHHGDGLIGGDLGYRALRKVIRHPASIALYQLLHPDLGIPLAHAVSRWSRHAGGDRPLDGDRLWNTIAAPRFAEGFDTVMIGHFHHAYERREGGRTMFVLGDWMDRYTYVVLRGGAFSLETWPAR